MYFPLQLTDLRGILTSPACIASVTGGAMASVAIAMFRGSLGRLLLLESRESKSLMSFSSQGTLRCICGEQFPKGLLTDRRQFCRSCGCEIVPPNVAMLDKHLSPQEIRTMTANLRRAAMRASHLELPPTITTIEELNEYLLSTTPKAPRVANSASVSQIRQSRVH